MHSQNFCSNLDAFWCQFSRLVEISGCSHHLFTAFYNLTQIHHVMFLAGKYFAILNSVQGTWRVLASMILNMSWCWSASLRWPSQPSGSCQCLQRTGSLTHSYPWVPLSTIPLVPCRVSDSPQVRDLNHWVSLFREFFGNCIFVLTDSKNITESLNPKLKNEILELYFFLF